ncbi:MAG TPA: phosphopantetheine-binding protein, partial [Ktedonobacteraceae bacterium]
GLARGYLHRPTLTAERFLANPFSQEPGQRMYKTGDLARYLPDGSIEFLSRLDYQVKVRGHRIELGEIEAVLSQHPAVRECVVHTLTERGIDTVIVAYVVLRDGGTSITTLRTFLEGKLPPYMLPTFFVQLQAMPLNPNGKIDRRLLPSPDKAQPEDENSFVAPRNETERALAQIWAEVLGLEQVGIHDSFFRIGGHSLLLTQVVSRIRHSFGVQLPLRSLFEATTIAEFAVLFEQQMIEQADPTLLSQMLGEFS